MLNGARSRFYFGGGGGLGGGVNIFLKFVSLFNNIVRKAVK